MARQVGGGISHTINASLILKLDLPDDPTGSEARAASIRQVVQDTVAPLALKLILENPGLQRHQAEMDSLNRFVRIPRALWNINPVVDELLARIPIKIDTALPARHDARPATLH